MPKDNEFSKVIKVDCYALCPMHLTGGDFMKTRNERGFALITILLLMVIVSLIGVIAINTSIIDIQISGNTRRSTTAFQGAEAGADLSIPVIENTIANGTLTPSGTGTIITTLDTENLGTEILGGSDYNTDTATANPDVGMNNLNNVVVNVDIDRLYSYEVEGGSQPFAMGYEGVGMGMAGGGVGILYSIDSEGSS